MAVGFDSHHQAKIAKQAANWQARMLEPVSEAEVEAFEAWLDVDPSHALAYAQAEPLADHGMRVASNVPAGRSTPPAAAKFRPALALAAALVLVVAGTLWFGGRGAPTAHAAFTNPGPAVRGVTLGDGSAAILDSGADVSFTFARERRSAALQSGRVRFDVAPDANHQFSVVTGPATVTARRAIFDVAMAADEVLIWVIRGEVVVQATATPAAARPVRITTGQAASVRDGRVIGRTMASDVNRWPAGRIGFSATPLADVLAIANRQGRPTIAFSDDAIGALRVTGVLDIRDTRSLARKLAATLTLRVEERESAILLTR